jgi:hypothetical protein
MNPRKISVNLFILFLGIALGFSGQWLMNLKLVETRSELQAILKAEQIYHEQMGHYTGDLTKLGYSPLTNNEYILLLNHKCFPIDDTFAHLPAKLTAAAKAKILAFFEGQECQTNGFIAYALLADLSEVYEINELGFMKKFIIDP